MSGYAEQLLEGQERRHRTYATPQEFLAAVAEYFQWCEDNPIQDEQVNVWQGQVIRTDLNKTRAFTKTGLASFLGIPVSRLEAYKRRDDESWSEVVELIEQVIYTQKFENAAAGLLNASIISRDLGLAEKSELSGPGGGPIKTEEVSARDILANRIARVASAAGNAGDTGGADGDAG